MVADLAPDARGFGVRFVSDREMRRLSHEFRDKDRTTDVLSFVGDYPPIKAGAAGAFPSSPDPAEPFGFGVEERGLYLGDVVISVPTARKQAATLGHTSAEELRILLLHGVLHCLGYDHEVDDGTMERIEQELRSKYSLPRMGC